MRKVIKRDGREVVFDKGRIYVAVLKAYRETGADIDLIKEESMKIAEEVSNILVDADKIQVEEIQDMVEKVLEKYNREVSTAYRVYRDKRAKARDKARLMDLDKRIIESYSDRASNGNTDENTFAGKEGVVLEEQMEAISLAKMNPIFAKKHIDREVYIHDLNRYALGMHNCLVADVEKLLHEGAGVAQGDLRPTKRFSTAMQLIPVYIQIQSMNMFGGCATGHLDFIMHPYIEGLIADKTREVVEVLGGALPQEKLSLKDLGELELDRKLKDIILERVNNQIHQSCQALITNLVTLQTRGNQTPFSSINLGGDVSDEGILFNTIMLKELDRGIGRMNKTAIFPIICYYTRSDLNLYKGTRGFEVTKLALKVQGHRHYPER